MMNKEMDYEVNILGTKWTILLRNPNNKVYKDLLKDRDGSTDRTTHTIVVAKEREDTGFEIYQEILKTSIRHEIIHAFLIESGLDCNFQHPNEFGHDETMIDWIALQWDKIDKVFKELGI